jgi:menaquinone-9 beta-reductase
MFDAVVVGAGPGGATSAAVMADAGLKVLLLDKARFPRDKICGDAISGKSVDVLHRLDVLDEVIASEQIVTWGITFAGPRGARAEIPFTSDFEREVPPGFVCARTVFDEIIVRRAQRAGAELREETEVLGLLRDGEKVTGVRIRRRGREENVHAPMVIGADGAYSVVARELGIVQMDTHHYCAGLRLYLDDVSGFNHHNFIEIHFLKEATPGYFWIFPMSDGRANVGVGMLSSVIRKRGIRLRSVLDQLVSHPAFGDRFERSTRRGPIKGWGLPLGSKPRKMYGDGWMLIGDAASLIDPFSGEGIGNAMVSGEFAARWTIAGHQAGNFSSGFTSGYERDVLKTLKPELRLSHQMQKLANWQWLLDAVIGKAQRSPQIAQTVSAMFESHEERKKLVSPSFYLRLLKT